MTSRLPKRAPRGFTLVELMVVVATIGALSSIAIPSYRLLTFKAKSSERRELVVRLQRAVEDMFVQRGAVELSTGFQPTLPPGTTRRLPDWRSGDWIELLKTGQEILGTVYYSYRIEAWEQTASEPAGYLIEVVGDLDGDGVPSDVVLRFERQGGVYQQVEQIGDLDGAPY